MTDAAGIYFFKWLGIWQNISQSLGIDLGLNKKTNEINSLFGIERVPFSIVLGKACVWPRQSRFMSNAPPRASRAENHTPLPDFFK